MSDNKPTDETSIEEIEALLKDLPRIIKELEEEYGKKEILVEEPFLHDQTPKE